MYRVLAFLLAMFCVAVVAQIVAVTALRDYQSHGDISFVRAVENVLPGVASGSTRDDGQLDYAENPVGKQHPADGPALIQAELLYLINVERAVARVSPLSPGRDPAVQRHAESMMTYGYRSHWDVNGFTPHMRYSMSGGTNRARQNIAGPFNLADYTQDDESVSWRDLAKSVHQELMESDVGRANILDKWHGKVDIGAGCSEAECWIAQQFESTQVKFSAVPAFSNGRLDISGTLSADLTLDGVAVWHHPYPRPLSLGQLDATYYYDYGQKPVVFVRPPVPGDQYYPEDAVTYEWAAGIDPYSLDSRLSRSSSPPLPVEVGHSAAIPWTTATRWEQSGESFHVEADLSQVVARVGPGVYTLQVWGRQGYERVALTNYTIFVV
ncbi:MAG: hypothetical protein OXE17_14420 [Chloroflexi bacterium]|nr:hypothetical protein [Chloroflexota bacterium]